MASRFAGQKATGTYTLHPSDKNGRCGFPHLPFTNPPRESKAEGEGVDSVVNGTH